jgi:hypothetical protein
MRRAEILCAVALLILAGVVAREGLRLDIRWGDSGPKGGFFPFWLAVILAGASASILFRAVGMPKESGKPFLSADRLRSVLTAGAPMAVAVPLVGIIGLYPTACLYLLIYGRWTGRQRWFVTVAVSILFPAAIFLIFERWFLIPLPKGLLDSTLTF